MYKSRVKFGYYGNNNGNGPLLGSGGGAGGGALLIASTASIVINGIISANGGNGPSGTILQGGSRGGGGSGGGLRLVAQTISGTGTLYAVGGGGGGGGQSGSAGRIRLEAFQNTFTGTSSPVRILTSPFALFLPTTSAPTVRVTSIDGQPVGSEPTGSFTTPDVGISKSTPVTVNIAGKNVPLGTVVKLYISSENAPDLTVDSTPLTGSLSSSTATASVTFPSGFSRGFVRATWTAQ